MTPRPISQQALAAALEEGVISADQAERLSAIEAGLAQRAREPEDEEQLRFVTGFADIFVTIGILLFVGALAFIMDQGTGSTPMLAGIACATWLLAEFFTGKKRMALPSIVLLVLFIGAVLLLALQIFSSMLPSGPAVSERFWFVPTGQPYPLAAAAILTTGMAVMHYLRFRVPITIAAGTASLCLLALAGVTAAVPTIGATGINMVLLACGALAFGLAMRFDMSDPARLTRRTDIAFWLHLLAAPLIVHPLLKGFLHGLDPQLTTGAAVGILWVFVLLGVLAVIIDRRAILVSGLVYAGIAFGSLLRQLSLGSHSTLLVPTVLLTLGAFILLLSAGWQPLRRALLRRLPHAFAARLPHPLVPSNT